MIMIKMTGPFRSILTGVTLAALSTLPITADAANKSDFTPHRAVFDLTVLPAAAGRTFTQVTGRFVYDYNRTCIGETYNHRMKMRLTTGAGQTIETDSHISAYEPMDGLSMQFNLKELLNGHVIALFEGRASRPARGQTATVTYNKAEGAEEDPIEKLTARTLFPMQHSTSVLAHAKDGKARHSAKVFDGDSVSIIDAIITRSKDPVPTVIPDRMRSGETRHKLLMAFFDPKKPDAAPHYQTRMDLWTNGVTSAFTMETEDLAVQASLVELKFSSAPECD